MCMDIIILYTAQSFHPIWMNCILHAYLKALVPSTYIITHTQYTKQPSRMLYCILCGCVPTLMVNIISNLKYNQKYPPIEQFLPHQPKTKPFTQGYLKSLGMARTAEVKRDARIGEAEARCDAQIKEAIAEEQRMASRFLNDTEIAKAQRDFELKKAAYDVEVQTKKAEAEMAYELQAAKTKQRIKEEQMQIKVVERTQEIAVQDQEMVRRERELEATVHRPAEAEKYRLEKIAEANRNRVILEAEAEAESVS